jgi:HSP20 family molecular chaperone IbpA
MSQVTVQKLNPSTPAAHGPIAQLLLQEMEQAHRAIEQRAFDRFLERGGSPGDPVQDWLDAEREMLLVPHIEVDHWQDHFEIRLAVEEVPLERLIVNALPESIIVQGEPQLNGKPLLRRIVLPEEIDPQSVTAAIRDGVLRIIAEKRSARMSESQRERMETSVAA